jgi:hypothetical protein
MQDDDLRMFLPTVDTNWVDNLTTTVAPTDLSLFANVFGLYSDLQIESTTHDLYGDYGIRSVQSLESLSTLIQTLTTNTGSISPEAPMRWHACDSTLLFLFVTVQRAVDVCHNLVSEVEGLQQILPSTFTLTTDALAASSDDGADGFPWNDNHSFIPDADLSHLPSASDPFNDAFAGLCSPSAATLDTDRALAITRLDMILFDFSRFQRKFSQTLLHIDDSPATSPALLARLRGQNERCLSALRTLHLRIDNILRGGKAS